MIKKTWKQLTQQEKTEFVKQMKLAGWNDESKYPNHLYQIKNGKCYGWIDNGKKLIK